MYALRAARCLDSEATAAAAVADLVAGGLPASKALASATSVAAGACGVGGRKGRVRPGFDADLLVVAGDPAADIGLLARADTTAKDRRAHRQDGCGAALVGVRGSPG